jgi:hypothetical protein
MAAGSRRAVVIAVCFMQAAGGGSYGHGKQPRGFAMSPAQPSAGQANVAPPASRFGSLGQTQHATPSQLVCFVVQFVGGLLQGSGGFSGLGVWGPGVCMLHPYPGLLCALLRVRGHPGACMSPVAPRMGIGWRTAEPGAQTRIPKRQEPQSQLISARESKEFENLTYNSIRKLVILNGLSKLMKKDKPMEPPGIWCYVVGDDLALPH